MTNRRWSLYGLSNLLDAPSDGLKTKKQVAALPVMRDDTGALRVMLITSRGTQRLIIPKGWPMKGHKDHDAAAIEAREEAGLIGRVHHKPVGTYTYWKRRTDGFRFCRVNVFILEVVSQLLDWKEKGDRRAIWFPVDDAADLVDDPGLVTIIRGLSGSLAEERKLVRP